MATPYWTPVIDNAKKRKAAGQTPFIRKHRTKAVGWTTCACGKLDPRLHNKHGLPKDGGLSNLAVIFCSHVIGQRPHKAEKTLREIERLAAALIAVHEREHNQEHTQ